MSAKTSPLHPHTLLHVIIGHKQTDRCILAWYNFTSSLAYSFVCMLFSCHQCPQIGVDFALKIINWDDNTVIRVQLWDIAGKCTTWHENAAQICCNLHFKRYLLVDWVSDVTVCLSLRAEWATNYIRAGVLFWVWLWHHMPKHAFLTLIKNQTTPRCVVYPHNEIIFYLIDPHLSLFMTPGSWP